MMPTLMSDTQMVLPTDRVVYQSQEVAAVIATSRYAAADGVAAVDVDYDPLPPVIDPYKALEPVRTLVRPDRKDTNHIWHWEAGNKDATEQVFDDADLTVSEAHLHSAHSRCVDRDVRVRRELRQGSRASSPST